MSPGMIPKKSYSYDGAGEMEPPTTPTKRCVFTPRRKPLNTPPRNFQPRSCKEEKLGKFKTISTPPRSKANLAEAGTLLGDQSADNSNLKRNTKTASTPVRCKENVANAVIRGEDNSSPTKLKTSNRLVKSPVIKPANKTRKLSAAFVEKQLPGKPVITKDPLAKVGVVKTAHRQASTGTSVRPGLKSTLSSRSDLKKVAEKRRPVLGSVENVQPVQKLGEPDRTRSSTIDSKPLSRSEKSDVKTTSDTKSTSITKRSAIPSGLPRPRGRTAAPSNLPARSRIPSLARNKK